MKTSKNNAEKIHNAALILPPAPDTRKPKKPRPKTRKNNKQTPPKPQQETKQRKQQHYFCSQKFYKHSKNKRRTQNIRKNYFERKTYSVQTTKDTKGIRKTKQYSEAGQESPKQVANRSPKKFRFHFLKKNEPISIFKKKTEKFLLVEKKGGIPPTAHSLDLAKRISESGAHKLCA